TPDLQDQGPGNHRKPEKPFLRTFKTSPMNAKHLIVNCVTEFVNAGDQNDTAALERVLHPQYQNVQDGLFTQKGLFQISKAEYIKLVGDMVFGGSPRSIDIHGIEEFGEHM